MKEDLLQYIWQFQHFNSKELACTNGEAIQIIHPGWHNQNQGPDFKEAKIKIGNTLWAGNIELHIQSSHWNLHHHSEDKNYDNVILHVVWMHDVEIKDVSGNALPALELQSRVSKILLDKYRDLMVNPKFISCENQMHLVNDLTISNWKERLVVERLKRKSENVLSIFHATNDHWEETFWRMIACNFGLKINGPFFQNVAESVPITMLSKHKNNIIQLEALLFGQAGLLNREFDTKYPAMLQKEYYFYQKKYGLASSIGEPYFLRMRPANFPTIRLAQLAMLIHKSEHLFSKIKETSSVAEVKKWLSVSANDYWHYHYTFEEETGYKIKTLGTQMIYNVIINTIIPVLFSYGLHHKEEAYKEKAIQWLYEIPPEKNSITEGFERLQQSHKSAFDSQAFIQLKNEYCYEKHCLQCAIGNGILKIMN